MTGQKVTIKKSSEKTKYIRTAYILKEYPQFILMWIVSKQGKAHGWHECFQKSDLLTGELQIISGVK